MSNLNILIVEGNDPKNNEFFVKAAKASCSENLKNLVLKLAPNSTIKIINPARDEDTKSALKNINNYHGIIFTGGAMRLNDMTEEIKKHIDFASNCFKYENNICKTVYSTWLAKPSEARHTPRVFAPRYYLRDCATCTRGVFALWMGDARVPFFRLHCQTHPPQLHAARIHPCAMAATCASICYTYNKFGLEIQHQPSHEISDISLFQAQASTLDIRQLPLAPLKGKPLPPLPRGLVPLLLNIPFCTIIRHSILCAIDDCQQPRLPARACACISRVRTTSHVQGL